jgi:hypothetical protein
VEKITAFSLSERQLKIVKHLAYFEVFEHPLTITEMHRLVNCTVDELEADIAELCREGVCFRSADYLSISTYIEDRLANRLKGELHAQAYQTKLKKYTTIIASFPFVRGVAVSGSLSKGIMHEDGDIDFFIITAANRLWICRTLLIAFKKIVLLNSKKYFCLNYFVDTNNMEIADKNIFTATELFYLIPVFSDHDTLRYFYIQNKWIGDFFEKMPLWNHAYAIKRKFIIKLFFEKLLKGRAGRFVETKFHHITLKHWQKKFRNFDNEKFELTMRSTTGVSKHHPSDFQTSVLKQYAALLKKVTTL